MAKGTMKWVSSPCYQQKLGPALALLLLSPLFLAGVLWLLLIALALLAKESINWLLCTLRRKRISSILLRSREATRYPPNSQKPNGG